jgi:hypothetical protein
VRRAEQRHAQKEMRCSQIKKGFFLSEQRCSVDHALASHVRGQRKFNREQENPEVRGGVNIADQFGYLPPTATMLGKPLRHPRNLIIVELSLRRSYRHGTSLSVCSSPQLKLPQGLP